MSCCPVTIRGRQYPSIRGAAREIGVAPSTIVAALDLHGHANFVGLGYRKGMRKGLQNGPRNPVKIGSCHFESQAALARALGLNPWRVGKWLKPDAPAASKDKLLAAVMRWQARQPTDPVDIRALELRKQGMGRNAIARELGVGRRRVSSILEATA